MKTPLCSIGLAGAITLACACVANAADGTITINGEVTDTTCNISVDGGTADATVVLPSVSASLLNTSGANAGTTPFSIALSGCTGSTLNAASTWFEPGITVDATTGHLNNMGGAANVQVQLLNSQGGLITAGGASQNDVPVSITGGTGTLNYFARYYATAAATAGTVTTSVEYTVVYQ